MPICPNCKNEIEEDAQFCPHCGAPISKVALPQKTDVTSALKKGVDIITSKPIVLVPAVLGAVITTLISWLFLPGAWWMLGMAVVAAFIGSVISYILSFASLEMARDAYLGQEPDISQSISYVIQRLITFIVASIVGALLSLTIILIPVALLMFVIIVVDETGIGGSISSAFKVLGERLFDILIILVISVAGNIILSMVPFIGSILTAVLNVVIQLALIDIYYDFKRRV